MDNITTLEKKALEMMQKENFRGISKDNVMQLVSILDKVDPEVAKAIIAQMPEVVRGMVENEKAYAGVLTKGIESCDMSTSSCFQTEDDIVKALQKEIDKEDTTFEQKKYYFEKMAEAAERKEHKDTEHKNILMNLVKFGGQFFVIGLIITAGIFIGKAEV
ncbi:MAG: hypothetical protein K6G68_02335 [Oscillospiraceae bacterium]|nr:hypothetical protein [Oscillospiraceae bacterium]